MGAEQVAVAGGPPPPRQGDARPGPPETVGRRDREPTQEWRLNLRNFFQGLWQAESGAAAAESAHILALVAVGITVAVNALGTPTSTGPGSRCPYRQRATTYP